MTWKDGQVQGGCRVALVSPEHSGWQEVVSPADGTFQFIGVQPGSYIVRARVLGAEGDTHHPVAIGQVDALIPTRADLVVALRRVLPIRGQVVDANGEPISEALVSIVEHDKAIDDGLFHKTDTDASGAFTIDVCEGTSVELRAVRTAHTYDLVQEIGASGNLRDVSAGREGVVIRLEN